MPKVLPNPDEYAALAPKPGSALWRNAGDARLVLTGAYAILLQVAHPTVGAGVSEHSDYRNDPWGRLLRTLDYSYTMVYGGPRLAGEMGARIRGFHQHIKGTAANGDRYHALEPEAYAWVHATLAHSIVRGNELLGRRMAQADIEELYADWLRYGRLIGVRDRDLPDTWAGFRVYFDEMVEQRLESTPAVHEVLDALATPSRPDVPFLSDSAWRVARLPIGRSVRVMTLGLLGPKLRERLELPWSRVHELELRAIATASRAATPLLPGTLRNIGPSYVRWRRAAIARGDAAAPSRIPTSRAA